MAENPEGNPAEPASSEPRSRVGPRPGLQKSPTPADLSHVIGNLVEQVRVLSGSVPADPGLADSSAGSKRPEQKSGHRFQRATNPAKPLAEGSVPEPSVEPVARPRRPVSPPVPSRWPAVGATAILRHPIFGWFIVQAVGFGLVLLGVLLGEADSRAPGAKSATPAGKIGSTHPAGGAAASVSTDEARERALQTADQALAAENADELLPARQLLESIATNGQLPGTEYQLALLAFRRGDRTAADVHVERSIAAGQKIAACHYLRGSFATGKGDYVDASDHLRLAAQIEPYSARYFFYWGESLRRAGKPQEAIASFRRALIRPADAGESELFQFKQRLAQVQLGQDDAFNVELESKLALPTPPGDWLLLAAAQNLQRRAFAAAAEFLRQAVRQLPPEAYRRYAGDFLFQDHVRERELAPLLQLPAEAPPSGLDPELWTAAEADPALWRTAESNP